MVCPNCGASLRDNAVFCSSCGNRVGAPAAQGQPAPAPPPQAWETTARSPAPPPAWEDPDAGTGAAGGRRQPAFGGGRLGAERPDIDALTGRLRRLMRLDTSVFREVRDDPAALVTSVIVVVAAVLLMALGGWLWWVLQDVPLVSTGKLFVRSVIFGTVFGVALWVAWTWLASVVLNQFFRRRVDWIALLRPTGLAMAPLAAGLLMLIDPLHTAVGVGCIAAAAMLVQIAIQEATDATPAEAWVANLAGLALWLVVLGFLSYSSTDLGPGIFATPTYKLPNLRDILGG